MISFKWCQQAVGTYNSFRNRVSCTSEDIILNITLQYWLWYHILGASELIGEAITLNTVKLSDLSPSCSVSSHRTFPLCIPFPASHWEEQSPHFLPTEGHPVLGSKGRFEEHHEGKTKWVLGWWGGKVRWNWRVLVSVLSLAGTVGARL